MTVTITKTVDIKTLTLQELKAIPQFELAELLFECVHNPHIEIKDILQKLENVVDLSEEDFDSFGYTKSQEMLEQEQLVMDEFDTDEPEATETVSETCDMTHTITDAHDGAEEHEPNKKKHYHAHRWSASDRVALYTAAEKGTSLSTILEKGTEHGREFSKRAYWRQLNEMGWSIKNEDNPMVKMKDHDVRWLEYQNRHEMNKV